MKIARSSKSSGEHYFGEHCFMGLWLWWLGVIGVGLGLHCLGFSGTAFAASERAQPGLKTAVAQAEAGANLYRRGDYALAIGAWEDQLEQAGEVDGISGTRGHLCYNIASAHYRLDEPMRAVAWLEAARRHLPRNSDVRANLDFIRGELGLPPSGGDGMSATWMSWIRSWTPMEAWRFALGGVLLLALVLAAEALLGGRWWRRAAALALALMFIAWLPWLRHVWAPGEPTSMVIEERGASGRSEPRPDARSLVALKAAEIVTPQDRWQDWVKVRTGEGKEVWVGEEKVLSIWR